MSGDIMGDFDQQYVGAFPSESDALDEICEIGERERDVHDYANQQHLFIDAMDADYEALRAEAEDGWDFVEEGGHVYVFTK